MQTQEQFNEEVDCIDDSVIEKHEANKKQKERQEELDSFRESIMALKKETTKRYEDKKELGHLFVGPEICLVDVEELTDEDLDLYGTFKDFKKGKITSEDFFCTLSKHRFKLAEYQSFLRDARYDYDFSGDSRTEFLAWLQNKWIEEKVAQMKSEKIKAGQEIRKEKKAKH
ncbi:MAG: hypothetical protein K9M15_00420 [Candidatus Marinimicrobia bacterium]|nr:hypothetical protein [Candidatus Neomarinimicrobiota bacterium]